LNVIDGVDTDAFFVPVHYVMGPLAYMADRIPLQGFLNEEVCPIKSDSVSKTIPVLLEGGKINAILPLSAA
jgi:hypothetical protein